MEIRKSLTKNFESKLEKTTTKINLCFIQLTLKILVLEKDSKMGYIIANK